MDRDFSHNPSSILQMDTKAIEQLRYMWREYISCLEKTPTESCLEATGIGSWKRPCPLRNVFRPLTALYSYPRITCRMKKIIHRQHLRLAPHDESNYNLCPQCGLVRDSRLTHENHAEQMHQRLKKLLAQHPNVLPNFQRL